MAYQKRTHRIYAAVTPVEYRKIQRLAKKDKVSAAEWIYQAAKDRMNLASNMARINGAVKAHRAKASAVRAKLKAKK